MPRITVTLDSLTADELWEVQCAWQRTAGVHSEPATLQEHPYVSIGGSRFGWTSPPMSMHRHRCWLEVLDTFDAERLEQQAQGLST